MLFLFHLCHACYFLAYTFIHFRSNQRWRTAAKLDMFKSLTGADVDHVTADTLQTFKDRQRVKGQGDSMTYCIIIIIIIIIINIYVLKWPK